MCGHTQQASIRCAHSFIKRQRSSAATHTWRGSRRRGRTRTERAPPHAQDSNLSHAAVRRGRMSACATLRISICVLACSSPCEQSESICARFTTGKAKTPPKWRTQDWHLSDAAWAPSQPAQIHMQGRIMHAADQQARKHHKQQRFEHSSAHRLTEPLRMRNLERKAATAHPGLEPESCGYKQCRLCERKAAPINPPRTAGCTWIGS